MSLLERSESILPLNNFIDFAYQEFVFAGASFQHPTNLYQCAVIKFLFVSPQSSNKPLIIKVLKSCWPELAIAQLLLQLVIIAISYNFLACEKTISKKHPVRR